MEKTCDFCDAEITGELWEVRIPRPSDPTDMCCIMWSCEACGQGKPASYWEEWIENEGAKEGYLFIS